MPTLSEARIRVAKGTKMGRRSFLHVRVRGESGINGIEGGHVTSVATASMSPA
jgi:Predicted epimerase, PhzC/PhzF homolog